MPTTQAPRLLLTDKAVKGLPYSSAKPKIVRDSKIPGFHLWVGKSTKTFRFQYETPPLRRCAWFNEGRVAWRTPPCRRRPGQGKGPRNRGPARPRGGHLHAALPLLLEVAPAGLTFKAAWEAYKAAITKEGKSLRTIADYQDKFDRHLGAWHNRPLGSITREDWSRSTPSSPKGPGGRGKAKIRLRQICRQRHHAARAGGLEPRQGRTRDPGPPGAQPVSIGKALSPGTARETGMGAADLPAWWAQLKRYQPDPPRNPPVHAALGTTPKRRPHRALGKP